MILACVLLAAAGAVGAAHAQEARLANFFGFEGLEVVKIDQSAGPILSSDLNGDGLSDLVAVNNFKSRIEIHYQKRDASPDDVEMPTDVNEHPEHWRYRRQLLSVSHRVDAVLAHDFDHDGHMDLIYAGAPPELVFMRQSSPGVFDVYRKQRVKDLNANRNGLAIANVIGDDKPELLALVGGKINVWRLNPDDLGQPLELSAGANLIAFMIEDYNGDGRQDVLGVIPEDPAPIRMWFGSTQRDAAALAAQVRFEMPALREVEPLRLPGEPAARIAVIERQSKRIVVYTCNEQTIKQTGDRDAAMRVYSFTDPGNRKRKVAIADADGDGLLDLLATDTTANTVVVYRQAKDKGIVTGVSYPSLDEMDYLASGNVDKDPLAEVFVMSEKVGVVGRSDMSDDGLPYPAPISIEPGRTPVALNLVRLQDGPHLAVVNKDGRNYFIDLIDMDNNRQSIDLGSQSRSPETILGLDADQDSLTDLLLFTKDKPMTMLNAAADGSFKVMESKDMGQFGLVQAATASNTAVFDVDGDGKMELLLADKNFVRAVRYEPTPAEGVSPGWQVVSQINVKDGSSKLVSVAILGDRIVAADKANDRFVIFSRTNGGDTELDPLDWREGESLYVQGFSFNSIFAGSFSGDGADNILAVGDDGFAVVRLAGDRVALDQLAAWRTDKERRLQHELSAGDVNSDGFIDLVSLDAGEQMCEIFSFTETRKMLYALGFQTFESKIFSGGEEREYEPSECIIADVTGDGANDVILLAHDRVLIYPQMTQPPQVSER
jgi:hypothetical protein